MFSSSKTQEDVGVDKKTSASSQNENFFMNLDECLLQEKLCL
jgi:hypothetical protein